ncbi:MAG: cation diffusion facilitator family transporter [Ignavibacteriaceae bacterium]
MKSDINHSHNHSHIPNFNKAFAIGIALNVIYIIVEFTYGLAINSMALIADAGHNLSDVLGLLLAWIASHLAQSIPTRTRTYGLRKSTILAALFNAVILLIAVGAITVEAIRKFVEPEPVAGNVIMIVAGIGVFINTITALLFIGGRKKDLNIKGAFLHMAADAAVSLGVVIAGLTISLTNWYWIDPVISLIIVVVITAGTWGLLKESFLLSMDAVPKNIDVDAVMNYLKSIKGVTEVHDLHIWAMSTTETALTAHLVMPQSHNDDLFLKRVCSQLHEKFGIEHSTIQIEKNAQNSNCEIDKV